MTYSCPKIVCKKCGQKGHISLDCNNNEIVNNENNERKEIQMRQSIACQRLGKAYDRLEPVCGNSYDGLNVLKSLEEFDMIFDMTEKEGMNYDIFVSKLKDIHLYLLINKNSHYFLVSIFTRFIVSLKGYSSDFTEILCLTYLYDNCLL